MEKSFLSSCQKTPVLIEYYRSLCNLGLVYLNESVSDTENGLYGESDFHILYRSIPLFRRSYATIKAAEVDMDFIGSFFRSCIFRIVLAILKKSTNRCGIESMERFFSFVRKHFRIWVWLMKMVE